MTKNSIGSVAAVVVTYNRIELLLECINALLLQTYNNLEIFVIDNASTDGTQERLTNNYYNQKITYFNTGRNLGGAGGFNYGIRKAAESGYNYLWLMDDDTIALPDTLEKLMKAAEETDYNFGFLSSFAQFIDGTPCVMNIPTIKPSEWFYERNLLEKGILPITRATFVSFLLPREIVLEKGLPIKEFFIWADDTEYSKRISQNHSCYFVNDSIVIHKMKTNIGATDNDFINETEEKLERYQYKFRNLFFVAKEESKKAVFRYWYKFLKLNLKCLCAKQYRFKKIKVLWKGYIKGIFFNPPIEKL